jgi:hypothetical protein
LEYPKHLSRDFSSILKAFRVEEFPFSAGSLSRHMCGIFFAVSSVTQGGVRDSTTKPAISADVVDLEIMTLSEMYTETRDASISKSLAFEMSARKPWLS